MGLNPSMRIGWNARNLTRWGTVGMGWPAPLVGGSPAWLRCGEGHRCDEATATQLRSRGTLHMGPEATMKQEGGACDLSHAPPQSRAHCLLRIHPPGRMW